MQKQHDFDGDTNWSIADTKDNIRVGVSAISKVSGCSNWQVNQEQNWKNVNKMNLQCFSLFV